MLVFLVFYTIDMKKTLAVVLAVLIAALLFAGCGSDAKTDTSTKESWLFSLQSGGPTSFDQSSSVLSVPVGNLVGFTDRPNRDIRDLTPGIFAAMWTVSSKDSFSADPPNASLTYWDSDGTNAVGHTVIVEITGNVSGAGNVMSMTLRILSPSGAVLPTKMYRTSPFIDNEADAKFNSAECQSLQAQTWVAENSNTPEGQATVLALQGPLENACETRQQQEGGYMME